MSSKIPKLAMAENNVAQSKSQKDNVNVNNKRVIQNVATNSNVNKVRKFNAKPPVVAGVKRPNPATSSTQTKDDGAPKPKVSKRIPDWDFKTKYQVLNDKHKLVVDSEKTMKAKLNDMENKWSNKDSEINEIKKVVNTLTTEKEHLANENNALQTENKKLLQEVQTLQTSLNTITDTHDTLLGNWQKLTEDHDKIMMENKRLLHENKDLVESLNLANSELTSLRQQTKSQKQELCYLQSQRRILNNTIQDLKGNIRVFCRVRPPKQSEILCLQCDVNYVDENGLEIKKSQENLNKITGKNQDLKHEFVFDRVFPENTRQSEIFEELSQLVQSALDGYNVCVFAYGQTGSGKTFTMVGEQSEELVGMIPRTVDLIFKNISTLTESGWKYQVQASFMEIYNENIRDLLNLNSSQKLEIYYNDGKGTTVPNLTMETFENADELKKRMAVANRNRATAATDFNEHSSRSHAVVKICLEGALEEENVIYKGSINLIDLAGSECAKSSMNDNRLMETKNINRSLSNLGDVISALHSKSKHIPYRNSKLTFLLQSSLGFNSKTLMIVNINRFEDCLNETLSSLRFAAKVKEVKTGSKRNKIVPTPSKQ